MLMYSATYTWYSPPTSADMDEIPMIDPPCGVWFFIWFATAIGGTDVSTRLRQFMHRLTLRDIEGSVEVDLACSLPYLRRHAQEL